MNLHADENLSRWLRKCGAMVVFAAWALLVLRAQQPESNFTGKATRDAAPQVRPARIHFEAGARTKWHTHERGQILLCEEGIARTQVQGHSVQELHPGETTYVPGGVPHWHGAAPDHAATLFSVDVSNGRTIWLGEVGDKEYPFKTRPLG